MQHKEKSRTMARKQVKTPAARIVTHYRLRKPSKVCCATCGAPLKGVPRARPADLHAIPKTARRPERPYGGVLCSACTRSKFKTALRK
jgi:large subunit ribosomal protein L34e